MPKNVTFYIIIIAFLVLGLITSVGTAYLAFRRPFSATSPVMTGIAKTNEGGLSSTEPGLETPISTLIELSMVPSNTPVPPMPTKTAVKTILPTEESPTPQLNACDLNSSEVLLLLGTEKISGTSISVANAIYLIKVVGGNPTPTLEYLAIPPNLWLSTPSLISKYTISKIRLGSLYATVLNSESKNSDPERLASEAILQVLQENFNLIISGFLSVNSETAAKIIDGLGGIEINNPAEIKSNAITFPVGTQSLNGENSIRLLESVLINQGVWKSLEYQELLLQGLHSKLNASNKTSNSSDLLQNFKESIITNISAGVFNQFDCILGATPPQQITILNIWQPLVTTSEDGLEIKDISTARQIVGKIIGDEFVSVTPTFAPEEKVIAPTVTNTQKLNQSPLLSTPQPGIDQNPDSETIQDGTEIIEPGIDESIEETRTPTPSP